MPHPFIRNIFIWVLATQLHAIATGNMLPCYKVTGDHEGRIQGRFEHIAHLPLGLCHQNLQGKLGNSVATLLLEQQVAHRG